MTLDQFRPHVQGIVQPVVNLIRKLGLTPNGLSVASFFVSILAGIAFYAGGVVLGVVMVALNAVFDALDGALARDMGVASPAGTSWTTSSTATPISSSSPASLQAGLRPGRSVSSP